MKSWRLSMAARELGVSEAWLRRAASTGRIPEAKRDLNGWRIYDEADIALLRRLIVPATGAARAHEGNAGIMEPAPDTVNVGMAVQHPPAGREAGPRVDIPCPLCGPFATTQERQACMEWHREQLAQDNWRERNARGL